MSVIRKGMERNSIICEEKLLFLTIQIQIRFFSTPLSATTIPHSYYFHLHFCTVGMIPSYEDM